MARTRTRYNARDRRITMETVFPKSFTGGDPVFVSGRQGYVGSAKKKRR